MDAMTQDEREAAEAAMTPEEEQEMREFLFGLLMDERDKGTVQ
jgi:hypothetical protein